MTGRAGRGDRGEGGGWPRRRRAAGSGEGSGRPAAGAGGSTWRSRQPGPGEVDPRPVVASLDQVAASLGGPRASVLATVFQQWEALVGPEVAAHAEPRSLRDGVLVVAVDQPAWAAQLRFLAAQLLTRLQEAAGAEVREIQVRVAGPGQARPTPSRPGSDTPLW